MKGDLIMCLTKYDKANIDKYFLSPYVKIQEHSGNIIFYNHIFETSIMLTDFSKHMNSFINMLQDGNDEESLLKFFKENITSYSPEEVLTLFLQKGVIV